MTKSVSALLAGFVLILAAGPFIAQGAGKGGPPQRGTVVVAVPARAGAVNGKKENSDAFLWRLFTEFAAPATQGSPKPVVFETWASDEDTFSNSPHWPGANEPRKFQQSRLAMARLPHPSAIDVPCTPPLGAATGGFPTSGTPTPCIAEEVKRNHPQFDYIVQNNLNNQAGLKKAYAAHFTVAMPTDAIAVKGDWVPVSTMLLWLPQLGSAENVHKLYYTTVSGTVEYALVSLHVSSRQNPNWVWGTFEHQMNPGRCDYMGCFDTFGATVPAVYPNRKAVNAGYGACAKTPKLKALMTKAGLSSVWENYCLKSTEVDYTAPDGTPYVLGNSVIEGITGNGTVAASSCIGCHVYASFGPAGNVSPTSAPFNALPFNPTGNPIPGVLAGSVQFDFMWGVLNAPAP